jgi:GNAT superfamily N-acetyltransferase
MAQSDPQHFTVRPTNESDVTGLPAIESYSRTVLYGMAGLGAVADLPPTTTERLRRGPCWVAYNAQDKPLGFALADRLEQDALLETLSIRPEFSGGGMGRALINAVVGWSRDVGAGGVLVSTYRDIPWDAPFYVRLGFTEVPHRQWTPQMHRLQREATAAGHDPARRLWMRLALV